MLAIEQVRRILVIGAGTMGQEIALQCALHGYDVTLYDTSASALEAALGGVRGHLAELVAGGRVARAAADAALGRIAATRDPQQAGAQADLVSESVTEDARLKRRVFATFHAICPPHTIFTTNTSSLLPSALAQASGRPAQFAALHFHPHVWESNVVDIMPHPGTAASTTALLERFARRIGQIPIVLQRESAGYVFNAMLNGILHAALTLAANGTAPVADIDRAWMRIMHMPIGPFGIIDRVGLDTVLHVSRVRARQLWFYRQMRTNVRFIERYVAQGRLGVKSGQGFYSYPDPAFLQPGFIEGGAARAPEERAVGAER